jgi:hypothetical protein
MAGALAAVATTAFAEPFRPGHAKTADRFPDPARAIPATPDTLRGIALVTLSATVFAGVDGLSKALADTSRSGRSSGPATPSPCR